MWDSSGVKMKVGSKKICITTHLTEFTISEQFTIDVQAESQKEKAASFALNLIKDFHIKFIAIIMLIILMA